MVLAVAVKGRRDAVGVMFVLLLLRTENCDVVFEDEQLGEPSFDVAVVVVVVVVAVNVFVNDDDVVLVLVDVVAACCFAIEVWLSICIWDASLICSSTCAGRGFRLPCLMTETDLK